MHLTFVGLAPKSKPLLNVALVVQPCTPITRSARWTVEEDKLLYRLTMGQEKQNEKKDWVAIAKNFTSPRIRTAQQCARRFHNAKDKLIASITVPTSPPPPIKTPSSSTSAAASFKSRKINHHPKIPTKKSSRAKTPTTTPSREEDDDDLLPHFPSPPHVRPVPTSQRLHRKKIRHQPATSSSTVIDDTIFSTLSSSSPTSHGIHTFTHSPQRTPPSAERNRRRTGAVLSPSYFSPLSSSHQQSNHDNFFLNIPSTP